MSETYRNFRTLGSDNSSMAFSSDSVLGRYWMA
jgi:hypothetical protein